MEEQETKIIKKALPCSICMYFDETDGCTLPRTESDGKDSFGEEICIFHVNKYTGEKTGGFKLVKNKEQKEQQKVWFTSDLHIGAKNILYFHPWRRTAIGLTLEDVQSDPKAAMKKHDEWIIEKWNSTVKRGDTVFHMGDFCLMNKEETEKVLHKLKGKKFFVRGNHDKSLKGLEHYFEWIGDLREVKFTNNQFKFIDPKEPFCIEICHYPLLTWNRRPHGTVMVHGHTHGHIQDFNINSKELRVDAALDSGLFGHEFIELEQLYNHFVAIRNSAGCDKFYDYTETLMKQQGFRM